jgi:hypothetical protein
MEAFNGHLDNGPRALDKGRTLRWHHMEAFDEHLDNGSPNIGDNGCGGFPAWHVSLGNTIVGGTLGNHGHMVQAPLSQLQHMATTTKGCA